ncbi:MAG: aspartate 1-decarboxylase [Verrucomicrobia bacterium]|nr:aspartate 1-decarboxylase [Verrucomicrobiota bacterium]
MLRTICKSKLHGATVTQTELSYEGSITLDTDLMEAADMLPWERVQIVNLNNGARIETFIIPGEAGSGTVCLNGPAARCAVVGDIVHVISYAEMTDEESAGHHPVVVNLDENNRIRRKHLMST